MHERDKAFERYTLSIISISKSCKIPSSGFLLVFHIGYPLFFSSLRVLDPGTDVHVSPSCLKKTERRQRHRVLSISRRRGIGAVCSRRGKARCAFTYPSTCRGFSKPCGKNGAGSYFRSGSQTRRPKSPVCFHREPGSRETSSSSAAVAAAGDVYAVVGFRRRGATRRRLFLV